MSFYIFYLILFFIAVLIVIGFIIPVIKDYIKTKKQINRNKFSIYDYYNSESKVFQNSSIVGSFLIAIIAIVFSIDTYFGSSEQLKLAQQTFDTSRYGIAQNIEANKEMISFLKSLNTGTNSMIDNIKMSNLELSKLPIKVDSVTISLSKLNQIIKEQKEIVYQEYLSSISPILKIDYLEKGDHFHLLGFNLINDGIVDIEDLKIYKIVTSYNINKNTFGNRFEGLSYWKSINKIKSKQSIKIYFDDGKIDFQNFKTEQNMLREGSFVGSDSTDVLVGVYIYNFTFKRVTDKKIFNIKRILLFYETNYNGIMEMQIISNDRWPIFDNEIEIIKRIEILYDRLH